MDYQTLPQMYENVAKMDIDSTLNHGEKYFNIMRVRTESFIKTLETDESILMAKEMQNYFQVFIKNVNDNLVELGALLSEIDELKFQWAEFQNSFEKIKETIKDSAADNKTCMGNQEKNFYQQSCGQNTVVNRDNASCEQPKAVARTSVSYEPATDNLKLLGQKSRCEGVSDNNYNYEEKWDKIIIKMLREKVAENPAIGADLAKGLDFYFHAAMEFAKQLEQEFPKSANEQQSSNKNTVQPKSLSAPKLLRQKLPSHISTEQMPQYKVSTMINNFEQKKFVKPADKDVSIVQSSSNAKRPSFPWDSNIQKEFKPTSDSSAPVEITKNVISGLIDNSTIPLASSETDTKIKPRFPPQLVTSTTKLYQKNAEIEAYVEKNIGQIPAEPTMETFITPTNVELKKPFITEVPNIPSLPIIVKPNIEPQSEPRFQKVRIGAICNDGWQSSSTGRGTCSHHGGVREWLYGNVPC